MADREYARCPNCGSGADSYINNQVVKCPSRKQLCCFDCMKTILMNECPHCMLDFVAINHVVGFKRVTN
jgi:hypothetical protein